MEGLVLAENIETDNVQWIDSKEIILLPKDLELGNCSSEDDADTKSTLSITDNEEISPKQLENNIGQLNITSCSGVHVGNQAYYHGDVTIQQYVLKSKDAVNALPGDIKGQITFIAESDKDGNKNLKSILSSVRCRHLWYIFIIVLVLIGAAVALILLLGTHGEQDDMLNSNFTDRLITRGYWLALPERGTVNKFKLPVHIVMAGHTSQSMCSLTAGCSSLVRTLQADAFSRDWSDIAYNFLVGGDGNIYEGRGWDKIAAHTLQYNNISLGVAFIGNFARNLPPKKQLSAFAILLSEGVKLGKLDPNYKILFQKQVKATESPGAALIDELMKWDHWSSDIPETIEGK